MRDGGMLVVLRSCCIRSFVWAAICPILKTTAWRKINLPVKSIQMIAIPACRTCASLCMCMLITMAICSSTCLPQPLWISCRLETTSMQTRSDAWECLLVVVHLYAVCAVFKQQLASCQSHYPAGGIYHLCSWNSLFSPTFGFSVNKSKEGVLFYMSPPFGDTPWDHPYVQHMWLSKIFSWPQSVGHGYNLLGWTGL